MKVTRNRQRRIIRLSQETCIGKVISEFGMEQCKSVFTPIAPGMIMNESNDDETDKTLYQAIVGSIQYAAITTRPDIAFAASVIGRYAARPSESHFCIAKRVLRYLQGTKNLAI